MLCVLPGNALVHHESLHHPPHRIIILFSDLGDNVSIGILGGLNQRIYEGDVVRYIPRPLHFQYSLYPFLDGAPRSLVRSAS